LPVVAVVETAEVTAVPEVLAVILKEHLQIYQQDLILLLSETVETLTTLETVMAKLEQILHSTVQLLMAVVLVEVEVKAEELVVLVVLQAEEPEVPEVLETKAILLD
jgi:hypothetical protein